MERVSYSVKGTRGGLVSEVKMAKQLTIDQFLSSGNSLPDPKGSLSAIVPRSVIAYANKEVMKASKKQQSDDKKRGPYNKYSPAIHAEIGCYAEIRGSSAASLYFTKKLGQKVSKSTVHTIKMDYLREKEKSDEAPTQLPVKKRGRPLLLGDVMDAQLQAYIKKIREQGGVVTASVVVAAAKGILKATDRYSLLDYGGHINPSKDWAYYFLSRMEFVRRKATTAKSKVSSASFTQLRDEFFLELFSIVTMEEIPPELVLNWDQTGIHLVPAAAWTMDKRGSDRVEIAGVNKRQITAVFCGSLIGEFLPIQLIYKGKTKRCHPHFQFPIDWNVTHSPRHWSTEDTMVEYISEIIVPFIESVRSTLDDQDTPAVIIMDNFKGQKTPRVNELLEENNIHVCLLPPNTTDKLQPMDVSINKPAKDFLRGKFEEWYADQVVDQFSPNRVGGVSDIESLQLQPIELSMARLKELSGKWLVEMHEHIASNPELVVNGFIRSGIAHALNGNAQTSSCQADSSGSDDDSDSYETGEDGSESCEYYNSDLDNDGAEFSS